MLKVIEISEMLVEMEIHNEKVFKSEKLWIETEPLLVEMKSRKEDIESYEGEWKINQFKLEDIWVNVGPEELKLNVLENLEAVQIKDLEMTLIGFEGLKDEQMEITPVNNKFGGELELLIHQRKEESSNGAVLIDFGIYFAVDNLVSPFLKEEIFANCLPCNELPAIGSSEESVVGLASSHFKHVAEFIWKRDDFLLDHRIREMPAIDVSTSDTPPIPSITALVGKLYFPEMELTALELDLCPLWKDGPSQEVVSVLFPNPEPIQKSTLSDITEQEQSWLQPKETWSMEEPQFNNEILSQMITFDFVKWSEIEDQCFSLAETERMKKLVTKGKLTEKGDLSDQGRGLILKFQSRLDSLMTYESFVELVHDEHKPPESHQVTPRRNSSKSRSMSFNPSNITQTATKKLEEKQIETRIPSPSITVRIRHIQFDLKVNFLGKFRMKLKNI